MTAQQLRNRQREQQDKLDHQMAQKFTLFGKKWYDEAQKVLQEAAESPDVRYAEVFQPSLPVIHYGDVRTIGCKICSILEKKGFQASMIHHGPDREAIRISW